MLEADLQRAHERADKAEAEDYRWAVEAHREAVAPVTTSAQHQIEAARAAAGAPDEVPAGWPEGWIADSDVGGHTHAALARPAPPRW